MDIIKLAEIGINKITTETGILTTIIIFIFFILLTKIIDKIPEIDKNRSYIVLSIIILSVLAFLVFILIQFNLKNNTNYTIYIDDDEKNITKKLDSFIKNYIKSGEDNNVEIALTYYSPLLEYYFKARNVNHNYIKNDIIAYYKSWSKRIYKLKNYEILYNISDKENDKSVRKFTLKLNIEWRVESSSGNVKKGTEINFIEIHLDRATGKFIIDNIYNTDKYYK